MIKLSLEDLKPAEASFELTSKPGKVYTLRVFSLAERIWINQRFGKEKIETIFQTQSIPELAEIAHHLLKDSSDFPTFMDFAKAIVSLKDNVSITTALLATIGIDKALIQSLEKQMDDKSPNAETPQIKRPLARKIGGKSSTTSQANMAGRSKHS